MINTISYCAFYGVFASAMKKKEMAIWNLDKGQDDSMFRLCQNQSVWKNQFGTGWMTSLFKIVRELSCLPFQKKCRSFSKSSAPVAVESCFDTFTRQVDGGTVDCLGVIIQLKQAGLSRATLETSSWFSYNFLCEKRNIPLLTFLKSSSVRGFSLFKYFEIQFGYLGICSNFCLRSDQCLLRYSTLILGRSSSVGDCLLVGHL